MFLSGLAYPVIITTSVGVLQLVGPTDMRGRLQRALLMVTFGIQPVAALVTGWSAALVGPTDAVRLNDVLMITGATLVLGSGRSLRDWRPDTRAG